MLTHFKKKRWKKKQKQKQKQTPAKSLLFRTENEMKSCRQKIKDVSLQDCLTRNIKENSLSWNERTLASNKKIYESIKLTDKCTCIVKFKIW